MVLGGPSGLMLLYPGDGSDAVSVSALDPLYASFFNVVEYTSQSHPEKESEGLTCSPVDSWILYRWQSPGVSKLTSAEEKHLQNVQKKVKDRLEWDSDHLKTWLFDAYCARMKGLNTLKEFISSVSEVIKRSFVYYLNPLLVAKLSISKNLSLEVPGGLQTEGRSLSDEGYKAMLRDIGLDDQNTDEADRGKESSSKAKGPLSVVSIKLPNF